MTIKRMHSGPRMSQIVVNENTVYLAGQVALDAPGASATEQTQDILTRFGMPGSILRTRQHGPASNPSWRCRSMM